MPGALEIAQIALVAGVGLVILMYLVLTAFPLLYVLLRWRSRGAGEPGLGTYAVTHYFRGVSILVAATAVALLLYAAMSKEDYEELNRVTGGLLCGSALFWLTHLLLARAAAPPGQPPDDPAGRLFGGFILLIAGTVAFASVLGLCVALFREHSVGDRREDLRAAASFVVVWGALYLTMLLRLSHRPEGAPRTPDQPQPPLDKQEPPPVDLG